MIAALVVAAVLVLALVYFGQRRMIYFPFGPVPPPAAVGLERAQPVAFTTADHLRIDGWFVPAEGAPIAAMIVFNGNGGHRGLRAPLAAALAARGISTLLFDYRGYGGNPGSPSESGLILDARAARDYVAGRSDVDPARIFYFGESLGAAVAVRLATEHPPRGLILRSPFSSLAAVGRHHYPLLPVGLLLRDRFASIDVIRHLRTPVLVILGTADRIVPPDDSRRLFAAAAATKQLLEIDADHNDEALLAGVAMLDAVVAFVDRNQMSTRRP
jgi:fermentation-respiration switch protein FrsA (DUF1100 family)